MPWPNMIKLCFDQCDSTNILELPLQTDWNFTLPQPCSFIYVGTKSTAWKTSTSINWPSLEPPPPWHAATALCIPWTKNTPGNPPFSSHFKSMISQHSDATAYDTSSLFMWPGLWFSTKKSKFSFHPISFQRNQFIFCFVFFFLSHGKLYETKHWKLWTRWKKLIDQDVFSWLFRSDVITTQCCSCTFWGHFLHFAQFEYQKHVVRQSQNILPNIFVILFATKTLFSFESSRVIMQWESFCLGKNTWHHVRLKIKSSPKGNLLALLKYQF